MFSIAILSVVLGLAVAAPQGFPQETAANQAARNEFIREYNRLAALAAAAPDIHIYMANRRIDNPALNTINHHHAAVKSAPVAPAFNKFAFSANLGGNHQFIPQANTFPAAPVHHAGHLAGHLAGHQARHTFVQPHQTGPIFKWNGPFADTVPAGVHGLPQQVRDTPAVAAAKAAHFAAHTAAFRAAPRPVNRF